LQALRFLCRVTVYSDSQYVVDTMSKGWAKRWRANGWRRSDKQPAANADLWEQVLQLCERHEVTFAWIRGHAGHPENERCDSLSVAAASGENLHEDTGYRVDLKTQSADADHAQGQLLLHTDQLSSAATILPLLSVPFIGKPDNRAISVRSDNTWLYVLFRDRRELRVPLVWFPALHVAQAAQRGNCSLDDDGRSLRFPDLDLEIRLEQLLGVTEEH
jgi:ribonuclease HI